METQKRKYKKKDGYTVSVVYFLRKEKDLIGHFENLNNQANSFPIYIRVTFLGQTVKIRSRLSKRVQEEEYEDYLATKEISKFIQIERESIIYSVRKLKPETIKDFKISTWSAYYNDHNESIYSCVNQVVMSELRDAIVQNYRVSKYEKALSIMFGSLQALAFLAELQLKPAMSLFDRYLPLFQMLSFDNQSFLENNQEYYFSLIDYESGSYVKFLKNQYGNKALLQLPQLEQLLNYYIESKNIS